jgi:hypothetical protein
LARFVGAALPACARRRRKSFSRRSRPERPQGSTGRTSPAQRQWMPSGPRLTRGGSIPAGVRRGRPICWAREAMCSPSDSGARGLLPGGQTRTKSPPGPNCKYGMSSMISPAFPRQDPQAILGSVRIQNNPNIGQTSRPT